MESILVVGAGGYMGLGIAQVCAQAGYWVHMMDIKAAALDKALSEIKWSLHKLESKGLLKNSAKTILKRITTEKDLGSAAGAAFVIESVFEIESLKREIFRELDRIASPKTILATNAATLPPTRLARGLRHPERVIGLHFFPPVPIMGLVEVVRGEKTSPEVFDRGVAFVRTLGKTPLRVQKDIPCFVMNRIWCSILREAINLVAEGIASPEDIDTGMVLGYGLKRGPFEMSDDAGLENFVYVMQSLRALGEKDLAPRSDVVEHMVKKGHTGKRAGVGFYRYTAEGKRLPSKNRDTSRTKKKQRA